MNMKILRTSFCMALAALMFSCSGEEPTRIPDIQPTLPGNGSACYISKIKNSGSISGCYDWEFVYKDARMVSATGALYNPLSVDVQYTSQLKYSRDTIGIKNTPKAGELAMRVVLNSDHYIEYLLVNKDEYRFEYNDGRLVRWNKTIKDVNFGAEALHARGEIEYVDGDIACITYAENNDNPTFYRCVKSSAYNINGLLPATLSKQLGCFGFEHLYYAGLLGKATRHLIQTLEVDYPEEAKYGDYRVDFNYSTNKEGQIDLCNFTLNGAAASVNYYY